MGIKDLLRFMKPYIDPIQIKKYAGQRVGIDAYSWLHKGAYSCSMELCLDTEGKRKLKYIDYFMHRINLLHHYKIIPVVVFDGGHIPCKAATADERQRRRKANYELAMEKLKEGNVQAATELFQRAISVTPFMAHQLIQVLKSENVEFIVAPYEADAQLAYLNSLDLEQGGISAVITEDSDLLAYGCKAVVFKMDRFGNGEELVLGNVFHAVDKKPSFRNFDRELFTGMCVLAGCDFLPSVHGVGIVKAHSFVSKYRNLERVLSVLKIEKGNLVSEDYPKSFMEAIAVFQHARVYDQNAEKLRYMKPLSKNLLDLPEEELDFLGPDLSPSVAAAIASGIVDPISMEAFNCFPDSRSHWKPPAWSRSQKFQKQERNSSFFLHSLSGNERSREDENRMDSELVLNEIRSSRQDSELHKLILQPKDQLTVDTAEIHSSDLLQIPDNNPFKRRKVEEIRLERENTSEELELTFGTKGEELEVEFLVPQKIISPPESTEDFCLKNMKEGTFDSIQFEVSAIRLGSEIRETKGSEMAEDLVELEGRSSSTTKRARHVKGTSRRNAKLETNCRSSENKKKSSILDFFQRL
ncbi:PREDICTED: exonuclease 1 [Tarenaya hassleriana]|uniref:exonuclease 1 n=1 Tax=Tarenaya hassleriana TaxID=28532 RepID=UPI00053C4AE7|nr:PREDICTED: exonuclease 1 [Tarenaya hassleriana]